MQIRLGVRYLKGVLKMKFPELRARAAAAEAEARRREVGYPQLHPRPAFFIWDSWAVLMIFWRF